MDLGSGIRKALARITGAHAIDEAAVKELSHELQRTLITNDVNVRLVLQLSKRIEERALSEKPLPGLGTREHVVKVVFEELEALLGKEKFEPRLGKHRVLLCGLFGAGKTTAAGKLAQFYSSRGLKVALIACDVHRPAAFEQLEQLAKQSRAGFYGEKGEKDAVKICRNALTRLEKDYDVLVLDSAGRSAFDDELVAELVNVNGAFKPDDRFLVVSADVGQVAGKQAQEFDKAVGLTGVIVTKMDGSGKGGGALSSVSVSGARIAFIGTGEKLRDLEVFDSEAFVGSLVGFPNVKALVDKAREANDEQTLEKAMADGKLDYDSFLAQMRAMRKMGPLKQVMQMLGVYDLPEEVLGESEGKLKQFEAAVLSMTPQERKNPDLVKQKSRQARIARGSGATEEDVRKLVQNFERASKMVKQLGKNRGFLKGLGKRFPGMGNLKG
ncbi:MAG: signal recognition particle receptor subunit alpha [Candidatus Micrarchaeia archaeon]